MRPIPSSLTALAATLVVLVLSREGYAQQSTSAEVSYKKTVSGRWTIFTSENFRVCTQTDSLPLEQLPGLCESLKSALQTTWIGEDHERRWTPRCDVIVYASLEEYTRALGPSVGKSVGCATLKTDSGRVVSRRIDIRVDAKTWKADSLPHELAHVVLADRFPHQRIPPWMDEGIGVLSESKAKQKERFEALQKSQGRGYQFAAHDLMNLNSFPSPRYRDAFYGQSAAYVQLLQSKSDSPAQLLEFADHAMESGYGHALRKVYGIDSLVQFGTDSQKYRPKPGRFHQVAAEILLAYDQQNDQLLID